MPKRLKPEQVDNEWDVCGLLYYAVSDRRTLHFSSSRCGLTVLHLQQGPLVLLVPRSDNVSTKPVKTSYSATAGTAYVTFDGARVPASHMLGKVGQGLYVILSNFNHERWMVAATSLGAQRVIVEECLKSVISVPWSASGVDSPAPGGPINASLSRSRFTPRPSYAPSLR